MPVCQLAEAMPLQELNMWQRWLQEPRGQDRADYHAATICQMIDRIAVMFSKGGKLPALETYMVKFGSTVARTQTGNLRLMAGKFPGVIPNEVLE